jgi:hypothetical protein
VGKLIAKGAQGQKAERPRCGGAEGAQANDAGGGGSAVEGIVINLVRSSVARDDRRVDLGGEGWVDGRRCAVVRGIPILVEIISRWCVQ